MSRSERRGTQALRQLQLVRYICRARGWVTVAEICEDLGVHYRTVYRDLEQLESIGVPFERRDSVASSNGTIAGEWRLTRSAMERWLWGDEPVTNAENIRRGMGAR